MEDAPEISAKEAIARFYFETVNILTKEDMTKYRDVIRLPLYLCLNSLARHKEKILKENDRIFKEQAQWNSMSRYKK